MDRIDIAIAAGGLLLAVGMYHLMRWNEKRILAQVERSVDEFYDAAFNDGVEAAAEAVRGFPFPAHGPTLRKDIARTVRELKK